MTDFVTIDLPDGRKVRFPAGMTRAEMADALNKLPKPDAQSRPKWTENIWGAGEADTPGERIGQTINDMGRAAGSGLVRGATALADLPGMLMTGAGDLAARGLEAAGAPGMAQGLRDVAGNSPLGSGNSVGAGVDLVAPDARSYQPKTTAGEYSQTVGEFIPGALVGPGGMVGNAMRYGVLPGLASEAAGQATEGTKAEPFARAAAALLTPMLTGRPTQRAKPALPRADAEDARMAETLIRNGVRPTVGQTTGSTLLRRLEGSADILPSQAEDFTAAAMKTTGSAASRATPGALSQASDDIVRAMNEATDGISFRPDVKMAQGADDVIRDYTRATASGNIVPDVRNIADEIIDAATNPGAGRIALDTLRDWRSRLGRLMTSKDAQVRDAAYGLRSLIDDATQAQLLAAGRADDVQKLKIAREQYRNWLAVADAATRAGAENGIISPTQLYQSVIRSQGRRNVAVGKTTDLGELSRSAAGVLRPESTVSPGGVRTLPTQLMLGGIGASAGVAAMPENPIIGGLLGALGGAGVTSIGQTAARSLPIQSLMMDPARRVPQGLLAAPGVIAGQQP